MCTAIYGSMYPNGVHAQGIGLKTAKGLGFNSHCWECVEESDKSLICCLVLPSWNGYLVHRYKCWINSRRRLPTLRGQMVSGQLIILHIWLVVKLTYLILQVKYSCCTIHQIIQINIEGRLYQAKKIWIGTNAMV